MTLEQEKEYIERIDFRLEHSLCLNIEKHCFNKREQKETYCRECKKEKDMDFALACIIIVLFLVSFIAFNIFCTF